MLEETGLSLRNVDLRTSFLKQRVFCRLILPLCQYLVYTFIVLEFLKKVCKENLACVWFLCVLHCELYLLACSVTTDVRAGY